MLTSSSVRSAIEGCVFPTTVLTIYSRMQTQTLEKSWIVPPIQRWGGILLSSLSENCLEV
jgi:hypothetical protein